jgi:uncharacterized protein YkwD
MKVRLVGLVTLCALTLILSIPGSRNSHSQTTKASLSQGEQDLLNEINQARANPQAYASYLEKLKPLFKGKEYKTETLAVTTEEGWSAVEDAITFLRAAKPVGPLSMSEGLYLAAIAHVKDQSGSGATGHKTGNSGGLVEDRVKPFGNWQGGIGENLSYGKESARDRLLTWLIDDGFASRGHRKRIMSADYKVAGLSCGPHPEYGTMCCLTLAGNFIDAAAAKSSNGSQTNSKGGLEKNSPARATVSVSTPTQSNGATKNTDAAKPSNSGGAANANKSNTTTKPRKF